MPRLEPDVRLTQFHGDAQVNRNAIGTPHPVAAPSETHRLSEEANLLVDGVASAARALRESPLTVNGTPAERARNSTATNDRHRPGRSASLAERSRR